MESKQWNKDLSRPMRTALNTEQSSEFQKKERFADHNWYCPDRIPCFRALRLFRYFAKLNQFRNIMLRTFEN